MGSLNFCTQRRGSAIHGQESVIRRWDKHKIGDLSSGDRSCRHSRSREGYHDPGLKMGEMRLRYLRDNLNALTLWPVGSRIIQRRIAARYTSPAPSLGQMGRMRQFGRL